MASSLAESAPNPQEADLPNLRHLRLLLAAVRLGSLGSAAEQVHVSQPAASQAMARLALLFGGRLLERGASGLSLTPIGTVVHARATRALAHLADASRRVNLRNRAARWAGAGSFERHASMAQLRALTAFAETGSFSGAARSLGHTEPAVQRAARGIEQLVGVPLFEGQRHAMRLSAAGHILATQAGLALKEIAAARAELRERAGVFDGTLVIGTLPLVRTRIVPDAVVALMQRHPAARIQIIDGSYTSLLRALRNGSCDMIVGALRGAACPPGLSETRLFDDTLNIVARAAHPLAGKPVNPRELARYPWVLPRLETPARAIFERLVREQGVADPARGHVETGSLVALRGVLLASDALSIISLRQVDYEVRQGLLVALDLPLHDSARPIGVSVLADWRPTALMSDFLDDLTRACDDPQPATLRSRPAP